MGTLGEQQLTVFLQDNSQLLNIKEIYKSNKDNKYDYDIGYKDKLNKDVTFEVKFDAMANVTGNIAIEIWNTKLDKASGLNATKADYWVMKYKQELYFTRVADLKKFVEETEPFKQVEFGGDKNARLLLFKIPVIMKIFKPLTVEALYEDVRTLSLPSV